MKTEMTAKKKYINVRGRLLDLTVPRVMGIMNITPDSFYKGSRLFTESEITATAGQMISDGADIIDIGGYSTRPGASFVSVEEERERVLRAVKLIRLRFPDVIISVDTFRADVAREAVSVCNADMINDISGGEADSKMFELIKELNVPYILMHMKGTPGRMEENPVYDDVIADLLKWFGERIYRLRSSGVKDIIIDPGFGFGKTAVNNFEILNRLGELSVAGLPVLAGISRKSMIWRTLGINPEASLNGTSVLNTVALMNGADILRVHDVKEAVQAVNLVIELRRSGNMPVEE
jgi:dihydropteroate synthase